MDHEPLRLAVIIGSTREGRFGDTVARWFAGVAEARPDLDVDLIDLAEVDLPAVYPRQLPKPVKAYVERIETADAFVAVTPEYNHGYPASLKQAVDLPRQEWKRKPVGFVSYGGMAGGARAVEQLRPVFAELHAVTVRDTVSFHNVWGLFDDTGSLHDPGGPASAAATMLDDVAWWGRALRTARRAEGEGSLRASA